MSNDLINDSYNLLIDQISNIYEKSQKILVEANWHMGKYIVEHLQENDERAEYGTELIKRLSKELTEKYGQGFSSTNLRLMRTFFLTYTEDSEAPAALGWAKCSALASIEDDEIREELQERIVREDLSAREVQDIVKQVHSDSRPDAEEPQEIESTNIPVLKYERGVLGQYTLATDANHFPLTEGNRIVDCGFGVLLEVPEEDTLSAVQEPTHTYKALLRRVVDGDTLHVIIEGPFNTQIKKNLRLNGMDTAELNTPKGLQAKNFVELELEECEFVIIRTYKTDVYGRFLADIFYLPGEEDADVVVAKGHYLNQELLDEGLAELYL